MFDDFRSAMPDAKTAKESAAAPELLAACELLVGRLELIKQMDEASDFHDGPTCFDEDDAKACDLARAAIAKATA